MGIFGEKIYAIKSYRIDPDGAPPVLDWHRLEINQAKGIETNFLADTNLMIEIDKACDDNESASDETLKKYGLLKWVQFLRGCDERRIGYGFTPFFAYSEMPRHLAQLRSRRLDSFARKFGLDWSSDPNIQLVDDIGLVERSFSSLEPTQQRFLALSFSALLLMLIVIRDGEDFSPIGKYKRYLREYKSRIGIVSVKELAIARYVFSSQKDCPGMLDQVRSRVEKNFARYKDRHPKNPLEMERVALNGAFDLALFNVMNVADTRGIEGQKLDCWLFTMDGKLSEYNDLCFGASFGTGQAGLFTAINHHAEVGEYWRASGECLQKLALEGSRRVLEEMRKECLGISDEKVRRKKIEMLPEVARRIIALSHQEI